MPFRVGDQQNSRNNGEEELSVDGAEENGCRGRSEQGEERHGPPLLGRPEPLALQDDEHKKELDCGFCEEEEAGRPFKRQDAGGEDSANVREQRVIALMRGNEGVERGVSQANRR